MKKFEKPRYETIYFANNVIATSACTCYDGTQDWGSNTGCPNANDPTCTCTFNTNPAQGNCVDPV